LNKKLFSIFSIFLIFILFSLGGWQLVRLQWKKDLIKDINLSISQPAKSLITENIKNYQKVKSQGILFKNNYFVYRLNEKGKYGFNLVSILQLNTTDAVIIQRGWVGKIEKSMMTNNQEVYSFEGVLYPLKSKGMFTPDNNPKENFLYYLDRDKLEYNLKTSIYPYVIIQTGKDQNFPVLQNNLNINISNNHLQYAITWFVLGFCIIIAFWYYKKRYK
jgi:surfeit locus 1 family protein